MILENEKKMIDKLLPENGFVRLPTILKTLGISKSTWWAGVKSGKFPKPVKIGSSISAWRVQDIRNLLHNF